MECERDDKSQGRGEHHCAIGVRVPNSALGPWAGNLVCCAGGGHPWHNSQYFEFQCGADSEYEPKFSHNPEFLSPGTVLFMPTGVGAGSPPHSSAKGKTRAVVIVAAPISAAFLLACGLTNFFRARNHSNPSDAEDPKKKLEKKFSARSRNVRSIAELESRYLRNKKIEDIDKAFELDRPVVFSLEAVGDATANFDEKRKIGEGGYGSVYLGMLGLQEVAIKKMRANKSKEFFAELKVLCRVHHKNVICNCSICRANNHPIRKF